MKEIDVNQMSPLVWAYIGDSVYEQYKNVFASLIMIGYIIFTIQNVEVQKEADVCWAAAVTQFNNLLNGPTQSEVLQQIKDYWIKDALLQTQTNTGTAYLLQKGFEFFPYEIQPDYYLKEYKYITEATREDILEIAKNIPQLPLLRFYAK